MKRYIYIVVSLLCLSLQIAQAQVDKSDVRRGNRDFKKGEYREADIDYRKALVKDSTSVAANYNLANTLFRQGDMEQSKKMLERVKDAAPATDAAADYYYNLGDVAIALQDWQGAVDALEQSLLRNPGDLQAKENYIYAKKKLEQQQNQNQDQDENDENQNNGQSNNDGETQDKKDDKKDNEKEKEQEQNDQNQNKNQDQKKPQQSQEEPPKITPQAAQQMLQAIQDKEKETQDKVKKEKAEALKGRQKDKNW